MNQQPFEDWLFSDESLSTAEEKELQDFLKNHPHDAHLEAAWRRLRPNLVAPEMLAPEAGFSQRWLQRWEALRREQERRRAMRLSLFSGLVALALAIPLGLELWATLSQPSAWLVNLMDSLVGIWSLLKMAATVAGSLFRTIPLPVWFALLASSMGLILLWSVAYNRFVLAQGATR